MRTVIQLMPQLEAVNSIVLEDLLSAPEWLYGQSKVQMIAAGNITEAQARDFSDRIVRKLGVSKTDKEIPSDVRVLRVSGSRNLRDVYPVDLNHKDTAVLRYYQGRNASIEENARMTFLGLMLNQDYFNEIRTEKQLGYIVWASPHQIDRVPGVMLFVQSPSANSGHLEDATDKFLENFEKYLDVKDESELVALKNSVLSDLKKEPSGFGEKVNAFWRNLRSGNADFNYRDKMITFIESLTMEDIREVYKEVILDKPHSISLVAQGSRSGVDATIDSLSDYREGRELMPRS